MAVDERALADSIHALTSAFADLEGPPVLAASTHLSAIVAAAADLLGVESVGILLLDDLGILRAAASTTTTAARLEEAQQRLGIGPGHDTIARRGTVGVANLAEVPDYAPLMSAIEPLRMCAVLSAPIWVGRDVVGNLNLIRGEVHRWTEAEARATAAYAEVVGNLLGESARSGSRWFPTRQRETTDTGGEHHAH
jgi:transcriptional regulator with GAF, ATPase, and Fis domain